MAVTAIDKIDPELLKNIMRMKPRLEDVAIIVGCSGKTVERFIREHFDMTFKEFRDLHMAHTRNSLVQKTIDLALSGNVTALIFALKNLCGWSDKYDEGRTPEDEGQRPQTLTEETALKLVKAARGNK
jgi:hypothetical protein